MPLNAMWIGLAAVLLALPLGYLVSNLVKGKKAIQLATELDLLKQQHEQVLQYRLADQQELRQQDSQIQEQKLKETALTIELANMRKTAEATEQRLSNELLQHKTELRQRQAVLDSLQIERNELNAQAQSYHTQVQEQEKQLLDLKSRLQTMQQEWNDERKKFNQISQEYTELKTTLEQKEQNFKEQFAQLQEAKQSLGKEFENLANKIFDEKGKTFSATSQNSMDVLLKPFREQIEGFQKRINDVHDASLKGNTQLNAEIQKVLDIGLKMSQEATDLTNALKGDSQQRGAWGEAQLERTLEMSGLLKDVHYEVQTAFKDAEGHRKQTDYLIKLPDDKNIVIDSKVSLLAYERAVNAESTDDYQRALSEHSKAVRRHIDDLSAKDYTNLLGMHSPNFVLMFMPIEPAYIEVLKHEKDLFEYGYKKGIVLVSHTTLIPILRTISNLWMIERSNTEARELSERAGDIYNNVCTIAERLEKLGSSLNTASNHYNDTVKSLVGKQGLYGKVERFNLLSTKINKQLPNMAPKEVEFQTASLQLIAEAVEDQPSR